MKPASHLTHIEPLEDRIAPATIINPYTITFQDGSGDTAVIHISKPLFTSAAAANKILTFTVPNSSPLTAVSESYTGNGAAENLYEINLLGRADAQGMSISVKVVPQVGVGDLQVNVSLIAAANFSVADQVTQGIDLGNIYVQGDLGQITAGDSFSTTAIQSINVLSWSSGQALESDVLGPIGSIHVQNNFNGLLSLIGYQFGSIGNLYIGGSLTGDSNGDSASGAIQFTGRIGSATIGNIIGTAGANTGELVGTSSTSSSIGSLVVTGLNGIGITGGSGEDSGRVYAQSGIGKVSVAGDLIGGSGQDSGEIAGPLGTVNITGNLTGGSGIRSGSIFGAVLNSNGALVPSSIGSVTVGGNLTGGTAGVAASGSTSSTPGDTGVISAFTARSITVGGSLIGGAAGTGANSDGVLDQTADTSGSILVNFVTHLTVVGNITGGSGPNSGVITDSYADASSSYGTLLVSGNITGGSGAISGAIEANSIFGGSITNLHVNGGLIGGSATQSGEIDVSGGLGSLFIAGNVSGGTANNTGDILIGGTLSSAYVKGNLAGNTTIDSANAVLASGYIQAGKIGSLDILGNISSGANSGGGGLGNTGAIRTTSNIVSLTVGGTVTGTAANPVFISAEQGPATAGKHRTDLAISGVTFDGAVSHLDLLAGYGPTIDTTSTTSGSTTTTTVSALAALGTPADGTAQIGAITFQDNLSATNVVAGVTPGSSGFFGTSGDTAIAAPAANAGLYSIIASIVVDGAASGDSTSGDSYGFVAQEVQSVQVGPGSPLTGIALDPGPNNDHLIRVSGNLVVNEVPPAQAT